MRSEIGFDAEVFISMFQNIRKHRKVFHLFKLCEFIQNTYYIPENLTKFNLDFPYTYLIHLGSKVKSKAIKWSVFY